MVIYSYVYLLLLLLPLLLLLRQTDTIVSAYPILSAFINLKSECVYDAREAFCGLPRVYIYIYMCVLWVRVCVQI